MTVASAAKMGVRTDVPQSLSSTVPLFTSPYVPQSQCSPTLNPPVPMFPSPFLPPRGTPYDSQSLFPIPFASQSLCSPKMFPNPYVPQFLCSPVPMFPQLVHQSLFSSVLFLSLCSPNIFPNPYVPPTSSPVPVFPSPYLHRDWKHCRGTSGLGNMFGEYREWKTLLWNRTGEHRDWWT